MIQSQFYPKMKGVKNAGFDIHDEDLILFFSVFLALYKKGNPNSAGKIPSTGSPTHGFFGWIFFCPTENDTIETGEGEGFPPKKVGIDASTAAPKYDGHFFYSPEI